MPLQSLDPMRSRAGQRAKPRFFNGPPLKNDRGEPEFDRRYEVLIVGDFNPVWGHRDAERGGRTAPCLGPECLYCCRGFQREPFEYIGCLLNGHGDSPRNWCVPPEWAHQLGEQPWLGLTFTTWRRRDGTVKIERSRKAPFVVDYPMIDVWQHCVDIWRLTPDQAGPRPQPRLYEPSPILQLPDPQIPSQITREEWEAIKASRMAKGGAA